MACVTLGCFLIGKRVLPQNDLRLFCRPGGQRKVTGCTQPDRISWNCRLGAFGMLLVGVQTDFPVRAMTHFALNGHMSTF